MKKQKRREPLINSNNEDRFRNKKNFVLDFKDEIK